MRSLIVGVDLCHGRVKVILEKKKKLTYFWCALEDAWNYNIIGIEDRTYWVMQRYGWI